MDKNKPSEQLEEGEIVDDDFEDISDNSITDSAFGKFVSSNGHLRALPLSSDSEAEKSRNTKTKKLLHHKSKVRHRRRKKRRISTVSSDSDLSPSQDLKGKLKEAIHVNRIDEGTKNPLETRLKAMGGLSTNTEPVVASEPSSKPELKSTPKEDVSDKMDDTELENLRLEALKTAILNKFQRRKRKKSLGEKQESSTPTGTLENKENDTPKDEQNAVKNNGEKTEGNNVVMDLEEDEDLLRASLLAGLAKKITNEKAPSETVITVKPNAPKLPTQIKTLPKRPMAVYKSNNIKKQMMQKLKITKPQVKPLIISVDDTDSDEEIKPKATNPPPAQDVNSIKTNVEKFLKEQRAKFEIETKKKLQVINKNQDKTILEKSAVKLLPKSQQIEYQQLLRKLRNAERRKRARKLLTQKTESGVVKIQSEQKVEISTSTQNPPPVEVTVEPVIQVEVKPTNEEVAKADSSVAIVGSDSSEKRKTGLISELTMLQRTLKEIKMQKNGSLQIKSKYQVLTPIIRKITVTSNERKKQEQRIKTLMRELNEARNNLSKSHERFSNLVKELVTKKEKIDKSHEEAKISKNKANGNIAKDKEKKDIKSVPVTSTPIKADGNLTDDATISTFVTSSTNNDYEDMDVCNSDETDIYQIDIVDPNDIDQIFRRRPPVKSTIPEYVSPLCFNTYERYNHVDPLGIMCPYEVNGSCRDVDCTYKHYLKNHERL